MPGARQTVRPARSPAAAATSLATVDTVVLQRTAWDAAVPEAASDDARVVEEPDGFFAGVLALVVASFACAAPRLRCGLDVVAEGEEAATEAPPVAGAAATAADAVTTAPGSAG